MLLRAGLQPDKAVRCTVRICHFLASSVHFDVSRVLKKCQINSVKRLKFSSGTLHSVLDERWIKTKGTTQADNLIWSFWYCYEDELQALTLCSRFVFTAWSSYACFFFLFKLRICDLVGQVGQTDVRYCIIGIEQFLYVRKKSIRNSSFSPNSLFHWTKM